MNEIAFTKVALPYGWLGNMSPHMVKYDGKLWKTSEALFQGLRFWDFPEIREEIRNAKSPMAAKMIAKKYRKLLNGKVMDEDDLKRMKLVLMLKLERNPDLKRKLLATGNSVIIEDCSKRKGGSGKFWGAARTENGWEGENHLGKLWMEIREELK